MLFSTCAGGEALYGGSKAKAGNGFAQNTLKRAAIGWGHTTEVKGQPRALPGFFTLYCALTPEKQPRTDCFQVTPLGYWYNKKVSQCSLCIAPLQNLRHQHACSRQPGPGACLALTSSPAPDSHPQGRCAPFCMTMSMTGLLRCPGIMLVGLF